MTEALTVDDTPGAAVLSAQCGRRLVVDYLWSVVCIDGIK
jgi:hypothetical protein